MFTNYYQARGWLENFIPLVYGKEELGLERIEYLLKLLGNPERKFKSIHVAGTSGKGSTAFYIAKLLQGQNFLRKHLSPAQWRDQGGTLKNFKVGLHISPHLVDIRERMQIFSTSVIPAEAGIKNGMILDQVENDNALMPIRRFLRLFNEIKPVVEKIQKEKPELTPSYFEILVAASFKYFVEEKVDWAVVEVGLGGRLDATNVLMPEVAVITNIGFDHTEILGDTIEKIAWEKAGIIKAAKVAKVSKGTKVEKIGIPVVTGATGVALDVIKQVAKQKSAPLVQIPNYKFQKRELIFDKSKSTKKKKMGRTLNWEIAEKAVEVALSLRGAERRGNLKRGRNGHQGDLAMIMGGLPGRFEEIDEGVILDGAHNPDKIRSLIEFIRKHPFFRHSRVNENPDPRVREDDSTINEVILVLAFKEGKDWHAMVDLLIKNLPIKQIIATEFQAVTDTGKGSAVDPEEIRDYVAKVHSAQCTVISNSQEAVFEALLSSIDNRQSTIVLVTGSLYLVGEVSTMWKLPQF